MYPSAYPSVTITAISAEWVDHFAPLHDGLVGFVVLHHKDSTKDHPRLCVMAFDGDAVREIVDNEGRGFEEVVDGTQVGEAMARLWLEIKGRVEAIWERQSETSPRAGMRGPTDE